MIRVFIADDHAIVRDGIRRLLCETDGMEVVGESADGLDTMRQLEAQDCDVLVLDMSLPGLSGQEVFRQLRDKRPQLPVVVFSSFPEELYAPRMLAAGAFAYLDKERASSELLHAIREAAGGRRYIPSSVAERLIPDRRTMRAPHERLSDREHQVFVMLAQGRPPSDVARELGIGASTVSTHISHIKEKLGAKSLGEIVQYAYRTGIVA